MKQRIISALIALAIIVPIIYFGGSAYLLAVGVISMFAYKEITEIKIFKKNIPQAIKVLGVFVYLLFIMRFNIYIPYINLYYLDILFGITLLIIPTLFYKKNKYKFEHAFYFFGILLFLGYAFSGLIAARSSLYMFIYLISICMLSDTFAYFTGMLIGKHKLLPEVSPKKTVEGSIGGLIIGTIVPLILYHNLINEINLKIIIITIIFAVVSQLGDLLFSKLKRENDVKDFSNIMPGHGGVLDRLDSILVVSLFYLVFMMFI